MADSSRPKSKWKLPSFRVPGSARPSSPDHANPSPDFDLDAVGNARPLRPAGEADVVLILPNHGAHIVPCPPDPRTGKPVPGPSRLMGEVELRIPAGGRRVKAIRLIRRDYSWLDPKDPDGWRVLDEAVSDLEGELDLTEGVHRFPFNETLPASLTTFSAMLYAPLSQAGAHLFVQAIGAEPEEYPGHDFLDLSNVPWTPRTSATAPPTYTSTGTRLEERPWLERTISHWRSLFAEPDVSPNGDPVRLDDRFTVVVPDVGVIQCRSYAENLCLAGPLVSQYRVLSPSPKATIIAVRTVLLQNETTHSPEGQVKRPVKVAKCVTLGDYEVNGPVTDVLWRGTEAGGTDEGDFQRIKHGRFPTTDDFWWSSISGTNSPLHIEHTLVHEVYFSVYGQDMYGNELDTPGPGSVRLARHDNDVPRADIVKPCPSCGKPPISNICQRCTSAHLPHIAHEKGPSYCATCSGRSLIPRDPRSREFFRCACADHVAWTDAGCPDEGLRIPEDEADPRLAAAVREMRRDEMVAVKVDAEWNSKG